MARKLKDIIQNKENQALLMVNLMVFDKFRDNLIETVIEPEFVADAKTEWPKLNDEEKLEWVKEVAIPMFRQAELQQTLLKGTRYMKLSKEGRLFLEAFKNGSK